MEHIPRGDGNKHTLVNMVSNCNLVCDDASKLGLGFSCAIKFVFCLSSKSKHEATNPIVPIFLTRAIRLACTVGKKWIIPSKNGTQVIAVQVQIYNVLY